MDPRADGQRQIHAGKALAGLTRSLKGRLEAPRAIYVGNDDYIFDATVRENITLWKDHPEEEVRKAAELAQIDFPLDKKCGENGSELSEGQKTKGVNSKGSPQKTRNARARRNNIGPKPGGRGEATRDIKKRDPRSSRHLPQNNPREIRHKNHNQQRQRCGSKTHADPPRLKTKTNQPEPMKTAGPPHRTKTNTADPQPPSRPQRQTPSQPNKQPAEPPKPASRGNRRGLLALRLWFWFLQQALGFSACM